MVGYPEWFDKPRNKGNDVKSNPTRKGTSNNSKVVMNVTKQNTEMILDTPIEELYEQMEEVARLKSTYCLMWCRRS